MIFLGEGLPSLVADRKEFSKRKKSTIKKIQQNLVYVGIANL